MAKRFIRWFLPLLFVLTLALAIAIYAVSPIHAASSTTTTTAPTTTPHLVVPSVMHNW